jgi:hypothetical protein
MFYKCKQSLKGTAVPLAEAIQKKNYQPIKQGCNNCFISYD